MVYIAWGNGVENFVFEDCFERGDDTDTSYVEELFAFSV